MFYRWMACLLSGMFVSTICSAEEPAAKKMSWGHVTGEVVFEGRLDDPRLQKYFADQPIYGPVRRGEEPRIVNVVPNQTLIVDPKTKGVKNALVYLKTRPDNLHPSFTKRPLPSVELEYANYQFRPRVFSLQVGQTLKMIVDKVSGESTNFRADFRKNDPFNVFVTPEGPGRKWLPKRPEPDIPVAIVSSIVPTARAYCVVTDHPYVAITDHWGRFELKNLSAGKHELVIWHETVGYVARSVTVGVKANETTRLQPRAITVEQLAK